MDEGNGMYYLLTPVSVIGPWQDEYSAICFAADVFGEDYHGWGLLIVAKDQLTYVMGDDERPRYSVVEYVLRQGLLGLDQWDDGIDTTEWIQQYGPGCFLPGSDAHKRLLESLRSR